MVRKQNKNDCCIWKKKKKKQKRKSWGQWVTSILRPSTSVPWSFSLALSASALASNVTKPKPCKPKKRVNRGNRMSSQDFNLFLLICLTNFMFCLSTLDPLSLKMISTSSILPNCWKWGERGGKKGWTSITSEVLYSATWWQHYWTVTKRSVPQLSFHSSTF